MLHPQAVAFLQHRERAGVRPDHQLTVAQARAAAEQPPDPASLEHVADVRDHAVPGRDGGPAVQVRVYRPAASPHGVVLYLHGGGHVTGTLASYERLSRRLTNRVPATVVAVDYRRAPEHRCPAPVQDARAGYLWLLEQAGQLGITGARQIVLAGDSAGGNNAAVLAQQLHELGAALPALQVLLYPTLDAVAYRSGTAYPSYEQCGDGYGLTYADGLWYWQHYLGPDGDPADPLASPLRASDLAGLPPAYLLTVQYDVLRDEGHAYARRLRQAGVPVQHRQWDGHLHGFLGDPDTYDDAEPALDEVAMAIRSALTSAGSGDQAQEPIDLV